MQSARNAAASTKETAANMAASAKSGLEKAKATVQEKGERMTTHDPLQKEMAAEKKERRINQAELNKQEAQELNTANKVAAATHGTGTGTHSCSTTGVTGHSTGMQQMSAIPGHGTGEPAGQVTEGVVGSHPMGTNTGTGTTAAGQNTRRGGEANTGYGTGGAFR